MWQKISSFANSKFGLWFGSVVFLTFMPFLYNEAKLWYTERAAVAETVQELRMEALHRMGVLATMDDRLRPWELHNVRLAFYGTGDLPREYFHFEPLYSTKSLTNIVSHLSLTASKRRMREDTRDLLEVLQRFQYDYISVAGEFVSGEAGEARFEFSPEMKEGLRAEVLGSLEGWVERYGSI